MDKRESLTLAQRRVFLDAAKEFTTAVRTELRSCSVSGWSVETKKDGSWVTSVDRRIEVLLLELIRKRFPDHGFIGEETGALNNNAEFQWLVDPIDGTEEYVRGMAHYGTILALHYQGKPVVGVIDHPALEISCTAAFGLGVFCNGQQLRLQQRPKAQMEREALIVVPARDDFLRHTDKSVVFNRITAAYPNHRIFRTCYGHTCAALGHVDAAIEYNVRAWDLAATRLLIEEAGGRYEQVREINVPTIGPLYGAVFGEAVLVERLMALLRVDT